MLTVSAEGLDGLASYFKQAPSKATAAARMAINDVARSDGMKEIKRQIMEQVNFSSAYLTGDRLRIAKFASNTSLEARIVARKRATSLARFAKGSIKAKGEESPGVTVEVRRGGATSLRKAWLVRLKAGASLDEDNYNVGLAVRVKPGERVVGKYSAHTSWLVKNKVALLYGPSVDQVFREVADDVVPFIANAMNAKFHRHFARLMNE